MSFYVNGCYGSLCNSYILFDVVVVNVEVGYQLVIVLQWIFVVKGDDFVLQMVFQIVQCSVWLYGCCEFVGGGFYGDGGSGFFWCQFVVDQQCIGYLSGYGFGVVCVNDVDYYWYLQLVGVFNGLMDELMQFVKGE